MKNSVLCLFKAASMYFWSTKFFFGIQNFFLVYQIFFWSTKFLFGIPNIGELSCPSNFTRVFLILGLKFFFKSRKFHGIEKLLLQRPWTETGFTIIYLFEQLLSKIRQKNYEFKSTFSIFWKQKIVPVFSLVQYSRISRTSRTKIFKK